MDCKNAQSLLNAYVDGELELTGALELEAHLENCAQCRALRDQLAGLRRQLREGLTPCRADRAARAAEPSRGRPANGAPAAW
jgi:predicted anti-sigma-YlaC factor YlaD